jgi:hypothetical protein
MRDFGDQERLLKSSERLVLYGMLNNMNEEEIKEAKCSPYYEVVTSSAALQQAAQRDKIYL